jgi:hypothetical protein
MNGKTPQKAGLAPPATINSSRVPEFPGITKHTIPRRQRPYIVYAIYETQPLMHSRPVCAFRGLSIPWRLLRQIRA